MIFSMIERAALCISGLRLIEYLPSMAPAVSNTYSSIAVFNVEVATRVTVTCGGNTNNPGVVSL